MKSITKIIFLILSVILLSHNSILSQEIKDVSFEVQGENILIYYTLVAPAQDEFEISAELKRESIPSFSYTPDNLSKDYGDGQYAGIRKSIVWEVSENEMLMFDGDDFYFEVFANKIESSGGIPWYYYVGTAAVGGAAAVVLLGGDDKKDTPTTTNFPSPPTRP